MTDRDALVESLNRIYQKYLNKKIPDVRSLMYSGNIGGLIKDAICGYFKNKKVVGEKIHVGEDSIDISNILNAYEKLCKVGYI